MRFLEKFLEIIQNPQQVNTAIFYGGALRANRLNQHIPNPSDTATYLPLTSIQLAGLVDERTGHFIEDGAMAEKLGFSFDASRVSESASSVGLNPSNSTDKQRLIFAACFQEACNQINEQDADLPKLRANIMNLMESMGIQRFSEINAIVQTFASAAFTSLGDLPLVFEGYQLSAASIDRIQQQIETLKMVEADGIEIDNTLLTDSPVLSAVRRDVDRRIFELDRLIACLAIDSGALDSGALREHLAKLFLLRYQYCVLYQTERKGWTPKFHRDIPDAVPAGIARHLACIEQASSNEMSYVEALTELKAVSQAYLDSWFEGFYAWLTGDTQTSSLYHRCLRDLEETISQVDEEDEMLGLVRVDLAVSERTAETVIATLRTGFL